VGPLLQEQQAPLWAAVKQLLLLLQQPQMLQQVPLQLPWVGACQLLLGVPRAGTVGAYAGQQPAWQQGQAAQYTQTGQYGYTG